eukprot:NODE_371_length_8592_cov_0.668904.p6 type:complete len:121 gc:universal NODE_371_length_8592_cov_0.668904:3845-3483(-)
MPDVNVISEIGEIPVLLFGFAFTQEFANSTIVPNGKSGYSNLAILIFIFAKATADSAYPFSWCILLVVVCITIPICLQYLANNPLNSLPLSAHNTAIGPYAATYFNKPASTSLGSFVIVG